MESGILLPGLQVRLSDIRIQTQTQCAPWIIQRPQAQAETRQRDEREVLGSFPSQGPLEVI